MKSKSIMVFSLLFGLLLIGCQQSSTSITQMPAPATIPPTNTPEPTFTQTHTPSLTATKQPTLTLTQTLTISPDALFLSDMRPYNGPENIFGDLALDRVYWQTEIRIDGVYYAKGLGMHAPEAGIGFVSYKVPKGFTKFLSLIGMAQQDPSPPCASGDVRFRVFVNDELKFASDIVRFGTSIPIQLPVKEGNVLRLEVDNGGDDYECDHATWAEARFEP